MSNLSLDRHSELVSRELGMYEAAVLLAPGHAEQVALSYQPPAAGEVGIEVHGCGVCGSHKEVWSGESLVQYPLAPGAPGHEGWGEIVEVGLGISSSLIGQRVSFLGFHSFAEYERCPIRSCLLLPEELEDQPFPGEALACAWNVFSRANVREGMCVAVVGVGFLGALLVQLCKQAGSEVVAFSRRRTALHFANLAGADRTYRVESPSSAIDVVAEFLDTRGGRGCECVIEATGSQQGLTLASSLVGVRGRLVVAGYHQTGARSVNMQQWNWNGIDVVNAHERDPSVYMSGMRAALEQVLSGRLTPERFYTDLFPLSRLDEALDRLNERPEGWLKSLVIL